MYKFYKRKVEHFFQKSQKRPFVQTSVFQRDIFLTSSSFGFQGMKMEKKILKEKYLNQNLSFFSRSTKKKNQLILSSNQQKNVLEESVFFNFPFEKGRLKSILCWFFEKYGHSQSLKFLEKLKEVGFGSATTAGISLGIDDLKIPNQKVFLLSEAETKVTKDSLNFRNAQITGIERIQRFIYTWNQTNDTLKQEVIRLFETTDFLNPIYMMAFSGARGNMSQVRQLVGMRGLMSDPQGQIIDFPIQSNFREGLTLTEYLISTYGARKGIVDTALRTATAGYLTRRLVDVAQHTIVSNFDCGTLRGIFVFDMKDGKKTIYSFQNRLIGRVLAQNIEFSETSNSNFENGKKKHLAFRNQEIDSKLAHAISKVTKKAFVRSSLTCENSRFVCQLCYGWSFSQGKLVSVGEAVGIIAAQSIGEPGTQLTMRTFHTGGVFAGGLTDQILAPFDGKIKYFQNIPGTCVRNSLSEIAFFTKMPGSFFVEKMKKESFLVEEKKTEENALLLFDSQKNQKKKNLLRKVSQSEIFKIPPYALLFCRNNEFVRKKQVLAQFSSVLKKMQYGKAEQTFSSTFAGEFTFGSASTKPLLPVFFAAENKKKAVSSFSQGAENQKMQPFSVSKTEMTQSEFQFQKQKKMSNMTGEQILLLEKRSEDCSDVELKNDILWKSQNWTTVWIFAGNIFADSFSTNFDFRKGDFLKKTSVMKRVLWAKKKRMRVFLFSKKENFLKFQKKATFLFAHSFSFRFFFQFFSFPLQSEKKRSGFFFANQKKSGAIKSGSDFFAFFLRSKKMQKKSGSDFFAKRRGAIKSDKKSQKSIKREEENKEIQSFEKIQNEFSSQKILYTNSSFSNFDFLTARKNKFLKFQKYFFDSTFFAQQNQKKEDIDTNFVFRFFDFQDCRKKFHFHPQMKKKQKMFMNQENLKKNFLFLQKKSQQFFDDLEKLSFCLPPSDELKKIKNSSQFTQKKKFEFSSFFNQKHKFQLVFFQFLKKRKGSSSFLNLFAFQKSSQTLYSATSPLLFSSKFFFSSRISSSFFFRVKKTAFSRSAIKKQTKANKIKQNQTKKKELLFQEKLPLTFFFELFKKQKSRKLLSFEKRIDFSVFDKKRIERKQFSLQKTHFSNEKNTQTFVLKKILLRIPVEKMYYQNFGYFSSFSTFQENQKMKNFFQTFSTLERNEIFFNERKNGKREEFFPNGNENFFAKEPPSLSSLFFQNFSARTGGIFSLCFFDQNSKNQKLSFFFSENFASEESKKMNILNMFQQKTQKSIEKNTQKRKENSQSLQKTKNILFFDFSQTFQKKKIHQKKNSKTNFSFTLKVSYEAKKWSEEKERTMVFSDFYEKDIFWLPKENLILSSAVFDLQKSKCQEENLSFLHFSSSLKESHPFLFFVNRQGKKKPFSWSAFFDPNFFAKHFFALQKKSGARKSKKKKHRKGCESKVFDCFVKVLQRNTFGNHLENFQKRKKHNFQKNFLARNKIILSEFHPFRQKLSFFHLLNKSTQKKSGSLRFPKEFKKRKKIFQKNLIFQFYKRKRNKNLEIFETKFLRQSKKSQKPKNFFFGKKVSNQCFTCLPVQKKRKNKSKDFFKLQKNLNSKKESGSNFFALRSHKKKKSILLCEKEEKKKLHFQMNQGWPVLPFSSFFKKNFYENHKKITKKGHFFEKNLSFEQNTLFSEILILHQKEKGFGIWKPLLSFPFFFIKFKKRKDEKISFHLDSYKSNTNCRYLNLSFDSQSFHEQNFVFQKNSLKDQQKRLISFNSFLPLFLFQPFQYKVFENAHHSKKFLRKVHSECFSQISLFSCFQLFQKYHSTLLNSQTKEKNFLQKNPLFEMDLHSNFENMYCFGLNFFASQKKSEKNFEFFSLLEQEEKKFKNQQMEFSEKREELNQIHKKKALFQKMKKQKNQKKRKKSFFFFEKERKLNFSFSSVQFLPLFLSFSKPSSALFSNFPVFSLNPFQNTIEFFLCEKKSLFFEERFSFGNFKDFVHESFWLKKDTMNFLFSQPSPVQSQKIPLNESSFFCNFKGGKNQRQRGKTRGWLRSILQKNQNFYGTTEFLSPYEGELRSMVTHDMYWWKKASEISTLQKSRKLFTILTKKDLFSVQFPFQEEKKESLFFESEMKKTQKMKKSFETQFREDQSEEFKKFFSFLGPKQKEKRKLSEYIFTETFEAKKFFFMTKSPISFFSSSETEKNFVATSQKKTKISSFQTKYENKIYTFENLTVGSPSLLKKPFLGSFVVYGNNFFGSAIQKAGQILHLNLHSMTLRHGQPYLVSSNGILHFSKIPYMKKNVPLMTLPYQTVQAGDIVQGIPKVEQFFEARTTLQGRVFVSSLPILLKGIFERYKVLLPLEQATRQSFLKIQQILVDGVQRVYRSQGVSITEKHLEVVVRQMTTKVQILHGAQTSFFPGEFVNVEFVERVNTFLMVKVRYEPVILGITRASLEVESFLSASSFQQTTKILSFAALSRKKDFLKGLKENLLVGNLIPSGTGYFHLSKKL